MSTLDGLVVIILLVFFIRGIWVGFIRQIASILSLVLGFIVAGRHYGEYAHLVSPYIHNKQVGFLVSYLVIFIIVFCGVIVSGLVVKKVMSISLLGWFDQLVGALLGAGKGVFVCCLVFLGAATFISGSSPFFTRSIFYPYLDQASQFLLRIVKEEDLRTDLLPQQPAISEFFSNAVKPGKAPGRNTE
ncbi:MAG: CvpA family protein [Deltaproteobacteria bacterium]|jgi:membrane protein required for colicin V production|nr:CvpA family protein [Deltaproteobacteria bacterium]